MHRERSTRPRIALALLAGASLVSAARSQDHPTTAHGTNTLRIDSDVKLDVPQAEVAAVWLYLQTRYKDASWLNRDGYTFTSSTGDEFFTDVYFDTPKLDLLQTNGSSRHRTRRVDEGSKLKDGRQLLQVKMAGNDDAQLQRGELKYDVQPPATRKGLDDVHPMLGLLGRRQRLECIQRIAAMGLDARAMRPILTIEQRRQRIYVNDAKGPFATITLDSVDVAGWGGRPHFTEIEIELNEISYTEADASKREWMEGLRTVIRDDLQTRFPTIKQDQTPKYQKAFAAVEASHVLPVRRLIRWNLGVGDVVATLVLVVLGSVAVAIALALRRRHRLALV